MKEISEVPDRSSKDRMRSTIRTFRDKLPLADEELQSFSVPDDPPTRLAEEFLRSLKSKKNATMEKLQWLEALKDETAANTVITIITEVLTYGIHHGNCIIKAKPKESDRSTNSRDLSQGSDLQNTANSKDNDHVRRNRKS